MLFENLNVRNKNHSTSFKVGKVIIMLLEMYPDYGPRKTTLTKFFYGFIGS